MRLKRDASCGTRETAGRNTNKKAQISLERPLQLKPRYHLLIYGEVQRVQSPELTRRRVIWNKRDHNRGVEQSDAFCHWK